MQTVRQTGWRLSSLGVIVLAGGIGLAPSAFAVAIGGTVPFNTASQFSCNANATGLNYPVSSCDYATTTNTSPATEATQSYSQSGSFGSVAGAASASLSAAQLHMQASATNTSGSQYGPSIQSNAIFGDGFTTTKGGGPFVWGSQTATFSLALDGKVTSSAASLAAAGGNAFVLLAIDKPGTLDPNNFIGANTEEYFLWNLSGSDATLYYTNSSLQSTQLTPTYTYPGIPAVINATFAPGGDFDWALLLGASGQPGDGQSFNVDLSQTLDLTYIAPPGTTTTSASGEFDSFSDVIPTPTPTFVPEPASMLLLATGLIGGLAARKARAVTS